MSTGQGTSRKKGLPLTPRRRPPRIRVVLVDGQTLVRAALCSLISREQDLEVVGEAIGGQTAVGLVGETKPDVALIDLSAGGPGGVAIGEAIRGACGATRLLVLGRDANASAVRTAIALGVTGYVVKEADAAEIIAAIRAVHRGRLFISLDANGAGLNASLWGQPGERGRHAGLAALSTRERHVLALVAHGYTSRQIATTLSVSAKTVETYRARISARLGRQTRCALVQFALECGLLKPGELPRADVPAIEGSVNR
jgi:DNA-binding NarL/FixJ family response regulator